jgi:hypothetical protein
MENKTFEISLKCLFCDCNLEGNTEKEYASGDMLKCQSCGEFNDYDALMEVAIDEGKLCAEQYAKDEITKILKNAFK